MEAKQDISVVEADAILDCTCKVGRVADRYELTSIHGELVERWNGSEGERYSLRDLADYFNRSVLQAALVDAIGTPLDGETENYYRLLTADDVSEGTRVETRRHLEERGLDPTEVTADFVSHQTIHNHLRECLDTTYESSVDEESRVENTYDFVRSLQTRTQAVAENTLTQLRDADGIELDEFNVFVDLMVICNSCGRVVPINEVFENGGCVCQTESD